MSTAARQAGQRRRRWRQDPEGRRERILEEASKEFALRGYLNARVSDIARKADVAEGSVYHQFESKQGLLIAVGERFGRGLAHAAFGDLPAEVHPRDVGRVVRGIFRYVRATSGPLVAFLLTNHPDEGWRAHDASRAEMVRAIEATLADQLSRGLIREMNPRIVAELQFAMVEGALKECFLRRKGDDEEAYVTETTRCLAAILGQDPAEAVVIGSDGR